MLHLHKFLINLNLAVFIFQTFLYHLSLHSVLFMFIVVLCDSVHVVRTCMLMFARLLMQPAAVRNTVLTTSYAEKSVIGNSMFHIYCWSTRMKQRLKLFSLTSVKIA